MLLDNRYELKETLGQGGAGTVYRAYDTKLERVVAIKYLDTAADGPDQGKERLRREAALLSRLDHPNIVSFYDIGSEAGQAYLVLEYIAGCTLREWLDTHQGPIPVEITEHISREVLAALDSAHQAGVIHRDLKPENIMLVGLDPDCPIEVDTLRPAIKVMDFGLAYFSGDVRITAENLVAGTALYLPPEAALGRTVDSRADLYAVGLILYEMLTGRLPFLGNDPLVVISQHLHATPVSPRWYNNKLSTALANLILKLLSKNPADRYGTAQEVLDELEQTTLSNEPEAPPTVTTFLDSIARGRLIGRDEEIGLLRGAIDKVLHGPGSVLLIEGPPGIGKSRLVREAGVYARLKGAQVYTGHCYSADMALPYQPFINVVKNYVEANIPPGSTGYLPANLAAELVKLAPSLESHFNLAPAPDEDAPPDARLRLFEAVTTLLTGGTHPVVVILENLHRASVADLALFLHLAQVGTHNRRLLLIVTYRNREQADGPANNFAGITTQLRESGRATHLLMTPLSAASVSTLLRTLLEGDVAPHFAQRIYEVTEGNPFFIEEILKALIEEGRIFRDSTRGRWEGVELERLTIPASLKEVMERRLEQLSRSQRHILTVAALLGRQFKVEALLGVVTTPGRDAPIFSESDVLDTLENGVHMQLISRVYEAEATQREIYRFNHSLLHKALYEPLGPHRRRQLHRQIGYALEKLSEHQEQPIALPDELAYHFSMAGGDEKEKAISYNLIAINNALRVYASEVAVTHYELILELLADDEQTRRAWILEQMGDLYFRRTRQIVDAVAAYERSIELWQATPKPDAQTLIRLYTKMGEIGHHWHGHVARLDDYLAEALRLLNQDPAHEESLTRARVLIAMAFNRHAQSQTEADDKEALRLAHAAADLAIRLDAVDEEATALDAMQRVHRRLGELETAHEIDKRRLALIPRMTNPAEAVDANIGASHMGWETGDLNAAIKYCQEALATARKTDNIGGQWEALRRLMMVYLQWGKLSEAVTYAQQGVGLGSRAGILEFGQPVEALFHTHLTILHALQGETEAAARSLNELKLLSPSSHLPPYRSGLGWYYYEIEAWAEARQNLEQGATFPPPFLPLYFEQIFLIDVYGHQGDEAAFEKIKDQAEAEVQRWNMPYLLTIFHRGCGAFYSQQEQWKAAEAAFKLALRMTRRKMFWYQDARTWLDYGRMLARRQEPGDTEMAREFLGEAQGMFQTFGAQALAEKAWIELTRLSQ